MDATAVHMSNTMGRFTSSMDKLASAVESLAVSVVRLDILLLLWINLADPSPFRMKEKNTQLFAEVHLKLAERNTMIVEFLERRDRAADERLARIEEHQKCLNAILKQLQVQKDEKENTVNATVQPPTETSDQAQVIADLQRRLEALERKGESSSSAQVPRRGLFSLINSSAPTEAFSHSAPIIFTVTLMDQRIRTDLLAHQAIDEQIHALKIRRNTYCAVSQLPDEILSRIFTFTKLDAEQTFGSMRKRHQWMSSTVHVCRAWRKIGLNHPSLWSCIDLPAPNAMEMLFRSKSAPLQLLCKVPDETDSAEDNDRNQSEFWLPAEAAFADMSRIRDISVAGGTVHYSTLSRLFSLHIHPSVQTPTPSSSSPRFETLSIHIHDCITDPTPARLLPWGELKHLRYLLLLGVPLPPVSPFMPHLEFLIIGNTPKHPHSLTAILRLLNGTPNLLDTSLRLYVMTLPDPTTVIASIAAFPHRVFLPRLGYITIESNDITTCHIFDRLSYPDTALVACCYQTAPITPRTDFSPLRRVYAKFGGYASPQSSAIPDLGGKGLEVSLSLSGIVSVAIVWRKQLYRLQPDSTYRAPINPQAALHLPCTLETYEQVHKIIPWSSVNYLALGSFQPDYPPACLAFYSILGSCSDLRELQVTMGHVDVLDRIIRVTADAQGAAGSVGEVDQDGLAHPSPPPVPQIPLPKLRLITLHAASFEAPDDARSAYDALVALIQLRTPRADKDSDTTSSAAERSSWFGITDVALSDCTDISSQQVSNLSRMVTRIQWDGKGLIGELNNMSE
ncbi:hypothetical protein ONZ45_g9711 [Pleurotus djamor]|nr:hypothetical protein ONZ45_g9711 [Pleurotus djamor]